jgi:O-antigen/teichoic acid export membrane protein
MASLPIADDPAALGRQPGDETLTVARNVSTRYLAIGTEMAIGLLLLPFNVWRLGASSYGLWMLTASITAYFSVLDLGYSGALVKFVAQYRAKRDVQALNEILSTMFYLFAAFGVMTYLIAIVVALNLGHLFSLSPEQAHTGRIVLLVASVLFATSMACSVFGGVINGFQRYDLNNVVGTITSIVVAVVNVLVLLAGYGLIELVVATTTVRVLSYVVYRANAYRVFPGLRLRPGLFRRSRLREITTFSVYIGLIDWANKLNYSVDAIVIGAFLNTSAVAVWSIGQRLAETTQRLTTQLSDVLFPTVVDNDAGSRLDGLRSILLVGTRLSLATVVPLGGALMLMAAPLVQAWVGPEFAGSVIIVQLLALTVIIRVGNSTASMLLKGAGRHRLVAAANVSTAIVNVSLSVAIIRQLGLPGVALATLAPVTVTALFVVFPAGCRRVQLPLRHAFAEAVWPSLWPAAVMAAYVVITRPLIGASLVAVAAEMIAAVLVYAAVFLSFAVSAGERRIYFSKAIEVANLLRPAARVAPEGA